MKVPSFAYGEDPMADRPLPGLFLLMKRKKYSSEPNQNPDRASLPAAIAPLNQNEINFVAAPDEVARRACFSYVNQEFSQGHEVQHWLEAERQLPAERARTRTHDFHNKN